MIYATPNDVIAAVQDVKLRKLLDRADTTNLALDARLVAAVEAGNDEVDSYVRVQGKLPLRSIPAKLRQCAVILALRGLGTSIGYKWSEEDGRMYDETKEYLRDVAAHKVDLPFESRTERNAVAAPVVVTPAASECGTMFGTRNHPF